MQGAKDERAALRKELPSLDSELVALHKSLMSDKPTLDEKYDIAMRLLVAYEGKERELDLNRRRSPEDKKLYEDTYQPTHQLREIYAKNVEQLRQAIFEKSGANKLERAEFQSTGEKIFYGPARFLNALADKWQKDTGLAGFDTSRMGRNNHMVPPTWSQEYPKTYASAQILSDTLLNPMNWVAGGLTKAANAIQVSSASSVLFKGSLQKFEGGLLKAVEKRLSEVMTREIRKRAPKVAAEIGKSYNIQVSKVSGVQNVADQTAMQLFIQSARAVIEKMKLDMTESIIRSEPTIPPAAIRAAVTSLDTESLIGR